MRSTHFNVLCSECGYVNKYHSGIDCTHKWMACFGCKRNVANPFYVIPPKRPSWDEYFMHMAIISSKRATCDRRRVGCVIVNRQNQVVCTGYNGSAPGAPHCDDDGHLMHDGHCVRTIHAESNAVAQAASSGKSTAGCVVYVTCHPCPTCLMLLASAGVTEVIYLEEYHQEEDDVSRVLAKDASMHIWQYKGEEPWQD